MVAYLNLYHEEVEKYSGHQRGEPCNFIISLISLTTSVGHLIRPQSCMVYQYQGLTLVR